MSPVLQELTHQRMNHTLAEIVHHRIATDLAKSKPGHCLRVSTLPENVMRYLCAQFNSNGQDADVVLLLGPRQQPEESWQVSATRLIELRNAEERPLLAFIPPGLKAAAEDSFDVSTFVEVNLGDVPAQLRQKLHDQMPEDVQSLVDEVIWYMEKSVKKVDDDDIVRYFLTILENGATIESAGGAIFQFRLVPHFALLQDRNRIRQELDRNVTAVELLADGVQPLLGRIHSLKLKTNTLQSSLYDFLRERLLEGPTVWTKLIATGEIYSHLSFDQWQFADDSASDEKILLYMDDLRLTVQDPSQPVGPDNPPYLDLQRTRTVPIKWQANRKPATIPELAYYRLELVNADGAVVWESKNIAKGTGQRTSKTTNLKVAEFRGLIEDEEDEGIYFFRVRGYSESGEILNDENPDNDKVLRDPKNPEGKLINESEDIWFWSDPTAPPPVEPQRNVVVSSFMDARLLAQFAALDRGDDPLNENLRPREDKVGWVTKANSKSPDAVFNIVYDAQARYTLPVNNLLRKVEQATLANPDCMGRWRLDFRDEQTAHHSAEPSIRQFRDLDRIPASFRSARQAIFTAIRGEEEQNFISATVDLLEQEPLIMAYAKAYQSWLAEARTQFDKEAVYEENGRRRTEAIFLDLDIVELLLPRHGHVYLIAPTHPLRLLWHLQQAKLAQSWLETAVAQEDAIKRLTESIRLFMRQGLAPINLPPVIRTVQDNLEAIPRFYVEQAPLTPFWTLYMRENVRDKQTLRARVQRALGISYRTANRIGEVNKHLLAQKLLRYLVQHPYTHVLKINVFNPGNAALIVDTILEIEKIRKVNPALRYELRLFTQSDRIDDIGEAVEDLLNPERGQVSAEADAFTVPSRNHLFPKLRYSRNKLEDFLKKPEDYEAHVSILRDLFPVDVEPELMGNGRSSFLHGLIQEQISQFNGDATHFAWQRQLLPTPSQEMPGDNHETSAYIANILHLTGTLQASIAVGRQVENIVPTLRLNLPPSEKSFLYQVHAVSDWVFIIDRYLGLEYFDSQTTSGRPMYLLDFTPEFGGTDTDRLLLTTRAIEEVMRLVQPALDKYNLLDDDGVVELYFLQLLRSLSGRLALKLLSSPNHLNEALGLAMARLYLEQYGLLEDAILLPLDAHGTLFDSASADSALAEAVTLRRGDLLLITCDPEARTLHFYIIEVKWRSDLGDFSGYTSLRQTIEQQLQNSEKELRQHFDSQRQQADRLDRQIKTKELISLLSFYLERSRRYGLIGNEAADILRDFIQDLDRGYRLTCAGAGLIFDFTHEGLTIEEEHAGLVFHRVGHDYIRKLLDNGLRRQSLLEKQAEEKPVTVEESEQKEAEMERIKEDTDMRRDQTYAQVRFSIPSSFTQSPKQQETIEADVPDKKTDSVPIELIDKEDVVVESVKEYPISDQIKTRLQTASDKTRLKITKSITKFFLEQYDLSLDKTLFQFQDHLILATVDPNQKILHLVALRPLWQFNADKMEYKSLQSTLHEDQEIFVLALDQTFNPKSNNKISIPRVVTYLQNQTNSRDGSRLTTAEAKRALTSQIQTLADGYQVTIRFVGLVYDFAYEGLSLDEYQGIPICRIGIDYLERLLSNSRQWHEEIETKSNQPGWNITAAHEFVQTNLTMRNDDSYTIVRQCLQSLILSPPDQTPETSSIVDLNDESLPLGPSMMEINQEKIADAESQVPGEGLPTDIVSDGTTTIDDSQISEIEQKEAPLAPTCDVLLGLESMSLEQFGLIGKTGGKFVGLDLNGTNTISLFGVQGGGKSYTLGTIVEMASQSFPNINRLTSPLATVIFHYHESQDYAPEFVSMVAPNSDEMQMKVLEQEYGAQPGALKDVLLLTSPDKIAERKAEFPSLLIEPIYFSSNELSIKDWRFLMGAMGNQMYMKQINLIMRQLRNKLTLESLQHEVENSALTDSQKSIAQVRLTFAAEFINDNIRLADKLKPGRLIIVDLRDEFIEKDEALGLFVVMLNIFANAGQGEGYNKLIVFDEAHKYMDNRDLTGHIVDVIRQMRHQGVSLLIASQDPPSLPNEIIELSSLVIMHRFNSPQWLKHVQRSITALADLTPAQLATLRPGDAYIWATKATERVFNQKAVKMRLRPRVTQHGGGTKTAV
jgi:DNA phosphorothioation-dependent restriction protein DptH